MDGWAADTAAGAEVALLAWRRANVAELNSRARAWMADTGRLTGPELTTARYLLPGRGQGRRARPGA